MLIEFDGSLFDTDHIAAVRPSGLDSASTIIFTVGQSAVDGGFLVHVRYETVMKRLKEARLGYLFEMSKLIDDESLDEDDEEESEPPTRQ